jgi:hypothetical protein
VLTKIKRSPIATAPDLYQEKKTIDAMYIAELQA